MADHVTYSFLAFMKSIFHFCLGCYCGGYSQNGRSNLSSWHWCCWCPGAENGLIPSAGSLQKKWIEQIFAHISADTPVVARQKVHITKLVASGNDMLPDGTKPLPEAILTSYPIDFSSLKACSIPVKFTRYQSSENHFWNYPVSLCGQWVNSLRLSDAYMYQQTPCNKPLLEPVIVSNYHGFR